MTETGLFLGYQPSFTIDWQRIDRVLKNIIKGIFYALTSEPLAQDRLIRVYRIEGDLLDKSTRYVVDRMGPWRSFGDDVFMCRYVFKEGMDDIACLLRFLRQAGILRDHKRCLAMRRCTAATAACLPFRRLVSRAVTKQFSP
jgi:hypothetical protein